MSEGQDTNNELSKMSFKERLAYFDSREIIEITDGLHHLLPDSADLFELIISDHARLPILGMKDGRMFMIGGAAKRVEHMTILKKLEKKPEDVEFATSIEGTDNNARPPYLELTFGRDGEFIKNGDGNKAILGKHGTDISGIPTISGEDGRQKLEKIFGSINGLKIKLPAYF